MTPVSAVHVHVGMPDAETAIRVFNGLRRHLPLLEALAANSPFRHGRDTGLASAREITLRAWPRSGAPRELLAEMLELARPHARELDCLGQLDGLASLIEEGGGAGIQRAAHGDGEMESVLATLMERAASTGE